MKNYVCTDIGACTLKMASTDKGKFVVEEMPSNLVMAGTITSYDAMAAHIAEAAKAQHFGKEAAMILPASKVYVRTIAMPAMTEDQMKINIPYEFREFVGTAEKDYVYDYAVMETELGDDGKPMELQVLGAAASKKAIEDCMEMFKKAGMKLTMAAPEEMGYCNLVRNYIKKHPEYSGESFCFVDLGHTATRIHVLTGSVYAMSRIADVGGQDIDSAIAKELQIDEFMAHKYKEINQQNCLDLASGKEVYERIAIEVMRAVNFFGYNHAGHELKKVYLCGGGTNIEALVNAIAEHNEQLEICNANVLYPQELRSAGKGLSPAALGVALG